MKKIKRILVSLLVVLSVAVLAACGSSSAEDADTIDVKLGIVGDIDGPGNNQWNYVSEQLAEEGINIEFVTFSDYITPNNALAEGEINLNAFQTKIFLDAYNEESGNDLTPIADTTFNPLGVFSNQYDDVSEIKEGDQIAIPNDASNEGRALILLQTAGLIEVDPEAGLIPVIADITSNPLNLDIVAVGANQTARSLEDSAATIINNDMATSAGLTPSEDAIFLEAVDDNTAPYVNAIVTRPEDTENEVYQRIAEVYQTDEVKKIIDEETKGSSIPTW